MVRRVIDAEFFHITRELPYSPSPPLEVGSVVEIGTARNPFFGFYDSIREYEVKYETGTVSYPAIAFLKLVEAGKVNSPALPQIALESAQHYMKLARELLMEQVRLEIASDAPSRQTCIWLAETMDDARRWSKALGGQGRILKLRVDGKSHRVDAAHLMDDSEPLDRTYERARAYWRGEMSEHPQPELLFSGKAKVQEEIFF